MRKTQVQLLTDALEFAMSSRFRLNQQQAAAARLRQQHVDALLDLAGEIRTLLEQRALTSAAGGVQ